jgi:hypothetical protein
MLIYLMFSLFYFKTSYGALFNVSIRPTISRGVSLAQRNFLFLHMLFFNAESNLTENTLPEGNVYLNLRTY